MSTNKHDGQFAQFRQFGAVLAAINPFGVYQIFVCFCILFAQLEWNGNFSFLNIVGTVEPDWLCMLRDNTPHNNSSFADVTVIWAPTDKAKCAFIQANCSNLAPIHESVEFNSIVASFRLICRDANKPNLILLAQTISLMFGSVIGGHIGDWFGRQFLFYLCQLCIVITSCMTTASLSWRGYALFQCLNGFLFGILEVEALTLVLEYTNQQYRMIPIACFVPHITNMFIALIAHFSRDWQMFFVYLNLITSPIIMAFMLFHESPRWLIAKGHIEQACNVLNDLADIRWNATKVQFEPHNFSALPREKRTRYFNLYDLFARKRFAKQSLMQILSMFTYSMVTVCYFDVIRDFPFSSINILFMDGLFRLFIPILVIFLDIKFKEFTRRFQFLLSLSLMGICFGAVIIQVGIIGLRHLDLSVLIFVVVSGMINDSVFWMNIVQVTIQRYPTVIRCIAFGCLHSFRHIGTIVAILIMQPLMRSIPLVNFIVPFVLICFTLLAGIFLQPDTKGKALLDTMDELDYHRLENTLTAAVYNIAECHIAMQLKLSEKQGKIGNEKEHQSNGQEESSNL